MYWHNTPKKTRIISSGSNDVVMPDFTLQLAMCCGRDMNIYLNDMFLAF